MGELFDGFYNTSDFETEPAPSRYGKFVLKGATLGFKGPKREAEGIGENVAEFVGGIAPTAAITGGIGTAARMALKIPKLSTMAKLGTAAVSGGVIGGAESVARDEDLVKGSLVGAGSFAAQEGLFLGGKHLLGRYFKTPKVKAPEAIRAETSSDAINETITNETPKPTSEMPREVSRLVQTPEEARAEILRNISLEAKSGLSSSAPSIIGRTESGELIVQGAQGERAIFTEKEYATTWTLPTEIRKPPRKLSQGLLRLRTADIEQTGERFNVSLDKETGLNELVSKDKITDRALEAAKTTKIESPIISKLTDPKLDIEAQREPFKPQNIAKVSEEQAERLTESESPGKFFDLIRADYTPEAALAETLRAKQGLSPEMLQKLQDAAQHIKDMKLRNELVLKQINDWCK